MRGVTGGTLKLGSNLNISTHTPHARRDSTPPQIPVLTAISTHTPHARRDGIIFAGIINITVFQLTRLMRGVTTIDYLTNNYYTISTHTPHARRDNGMGISKNILS